jgi:hypothetical protein
MPVSPPSGFLPSAGEGLLEQANDWIARHVKRELHLLAPDLN